MKVKPFNKNLLKDYLSLLSVISIPFGFISIFIEADDVNNSFCISAFIIVLVLAYIFILYKSNNIDSLKINIKNNNVIIYYGDILEVKSGVKVITFNEYFDTKADNIIIPRNTLNGKFISKYYSNNIEALDNEIDEKLKKFNCIKTDREIGKRNKYEPGTAIEVEGEYILTAFAKCDDDNREYLTKMDYITYLMKFWESIDKLYSQRDIYIPLMGSGICRIDVNLTPQDYLEQIINSLNLSSLDLAYDCEVYIVLSESMKKYIDLYKIKNMYARN